MNTLAPPTHLPQQLVSSATAAAMIRSGAALVIAGDAAVLAALPDGLWIGGTIPYFMGQDGGVTTQEQVFVTPLPHYPGFTPTIRQYDRASLSQVCAEAPANGFSLVILPAFSEVHLEYAQHAPLYDDMFMKPLVGWVAGIHLDDLGNAEPKVRDGRQATLFDNRAVVMHVPLPDHVSANVNIVNLFSQSQGDVITFPGSGFEATSCLVNGKPTSLAAYLQRIGHDPRLPLVTNHSGALVNVSIKATDAVQDNVQFYGPVFPHVEYRLAQPFTGSYESALDQAIAHLPEQATFSCNCVLNYLYCELEGKRTGHLTGPMTFGEIAYVLLNQTVVHLTLETY